MSKEVSDIDLLTCPGCTYGKAKRKAWRRKGSKNRKRIRQVISPGQVVSVDQLISPTSSLVSTHRGNPTTAQYIRGTISLDHSIDFSYVHLMIEIKGEATVTANLAFERISHQHGVKILHYHAINGLFDTKVFCAAIAKGKHTLTFCEVNAHHQNGIAKQQVQDITLGTRTSLLHASHY